MYNRGATPLIQTMSEPDNTTVVVDEIIYYIVQSITTEDTHSKHRSWRVVLDTILFDKVCQ